VLITTVIIVVALVAVVRSMLNYQSWSCEVCMSFEDRQSCRKASGKTRAEAHRTALDLACSDIAPGMAAGISCSNSPPRKVACAMR
jgi:hypothetical protein